MIAPTGRLALCGHSRPNASWGVYCQQFVGTRLLAIIRVSDRNLMQPRMYRPFPAESAVVTLEVSLLRYHASPTIDRLGERIAADQGGKLTLDLDLEPLSRAVRVDRHTLDEGTEALHKGPAVVLCLGVLSEACGQGVDRFDIADHPQFTTRPDGRTKIWRVRRRLPAR